MKNSIAIILAIFILIVSFLAFTNTPLVVKTFASIKSGLGIAVGPALRSISSPLDVAGSIFGGYINLIHTKKENDILKNRVDTLLLENQRLSLLERENARFRELLGFTAKRPGSMIAATVIGEDIKNWFRCIIIDKGSHQGINRKMPVLTPKGVVGQSVEVDLWHTKVMVINDPNSSVDVTVEGKNTRGLLEGTGENTLKLKYVVKNDEIAVGDKLITSGKDGVFPKGIPAGIVVTVDRNKSGIFAEVEVVPYNNFRHLDEVLVMTKQ